MAVVNQILHRKNTSGTYDTIYLKANLANVTGTLAVANGGTGATDAATARSNLGVVNYTHPTSKQCNYSYSHPSTKQCDAAAGTHNHNASDINAGTLGVARGGTGQSSLTSKAVLTGNGTSAVSLVAVGNGAFYSTGTSVAAKFGTLPVAQGGTGATTAANARTNLGAAASSHTHTKSQITDLPDITQRVITQNTDDAPASMTKGSFSIGPGKGYIKMNVDATDIEPSSHTPGDTITWDNKSWLVCHYDSSTNRVYLIASDTVDNTEFGANNKYAGSTLAARCTTYQNNSMSAAALSICVDVTVNGVTSKVFVPSYEQMNGGFSWFNSNDHRRVADGAGYHPYYWTSSAGSSSYVFYVYTDGSFFNNAGPIMSYGFRPCVCVQLGLDSTIKSLPVVDYWDPTTRTLYLV